MGKHRPDYSNACFPIRDYHFPVVELWFVAINQKSKLGLDIWLVESALAEKQKYMASDWKSKSPDDKCWNCYSVEILHVVRIPASDTQIIHKPLLAGLNFGACKCRNAGFQNIWVKHEYTDNNGGHELVHQNLTIPSNSRYNSPENTCPHNGCHWQKRDSNQGLPVNIISVWIKHAVNRVNPTRQRSYRLLEAKELARVVWPL
jgi:hypothetical protein